VAALCLLSFSFSGIASMLGTNSSISQGAVREKCKLEVYSYLDMNAVINNRIIEVFVSRNYKKHFQKWMNSY
jgi:hypothetical protein